MSFKPGARVFNKFGDEFTCLGEGRADSVDVNSPGIIRNHWPVVILQNNKTKEISSVMKVGIELDYYQFEPSLLGEELNTKELMELTVKSAEKLMNVDLGFDTEQTKNYVMVCEAIVNSFLKMNGEHLPNNLYHENMKSNLKHFCIHLLVSMKMAEDKMNKEKEKNKAE